MNQYYDYCDTYDAYDRTLTSSDKNNKIKTFSCNVCKRSKLVLKKSIAGPVFKCDECIECEASLNQYREQFSQQNQGNQESTWRQWFLDYLFNS